AWYIARVRLFFVALLAACAAAPPPAPAAPAPTPAGPPPFLWRVEAADGPPSLLFGTLHAGLALEESLDEEVLVRLDASRALLVELDARAVDGERMLAGAMLPPAETLDEYLPAPVWDALQAEVAQELPPDILVRLSPWFPMSLVVRKRLEALRPGPPAPPMDVALIDRARAAGVPVRPLETLDDQLAALNSLPPDQAASEIVELYEARATVDDELRELLAAYRSGDAARAEAATFDPEEVAARPAFYEALFDRRNAAWMTTLRAELQEGGLFVAVGLGHLLGDQGLVSLLRAEGFAVSRYVSGSE
ncbi:MAG: TraB/GumN family protein, partial [Myxococcota bacterium]